MENEGNAKRRLMITHMVLENFKSYAGVQTVGPFHKSFSSVVGPNGSGKSNVIDALLFVFGKRAKQLRLNKVSELIHNSTNHQDLQEARVSVHFQEICDADDENFTVVENSDFVISRVAYRNNTSKYFINDKAKSVTEVTNLLKGKGVDLDNNRFLILQGEVEQISMMKPKGQSPHEDGLLEYLEDIIGTNSYIPKIEEGSKVLEEMNENRIGMIQRMRIVEKEKNTLEGFKKETEAYFSRDSERLKYKKKFHEISLSESEAQCGQLEGKIQEAKSQIEEEKKKSTEYKSTLDEMEKKHSKIHGEYEGIKSELTKCQNEFKEFERKDVKYREDVKHSKAKIKKLEEKKTKDEVKIEESLKEIEKTKATVPQLEEKLTNLTEKLETEEKVLEKMQESAKGEILQLNSQLSSARAELAPFEKELNNSKAKLDISLSEKDLIQKSHKAAKSQLEEAQKSFQGLEPAILEREEEMKKIKVFVENSKGKLTGLEEEEKKLAEEENSLEKKVQISRGKVAELAEAIKSEATQNSVLQALMKAKRSGKIPGIFGRLGDLGAIDAKYDTAISTACGALEYIVVDSASTAESCVDLLRSTGLGVATFLILEKQQHLVSAMREKVSTPENVPRLFDLVKPAEKSLLPAFYFALRNTLVAKDLDQGNRIAYGSDRRFRRVVTLEGALFESSGTISGGGGKPRGGKMGTSVRASGASKESLEVQERELKLALERVDKVRRERANVVEEMEKIKVNLNELQKKIPKLKLEIESLRGQKGEMRERLRGLEASSTPKESELTRIQELENLIKMAEGEISSIQKNSAHLFKKVEELQQKVENVGGEKMKRQKEAISALQNELDSTSSEITKQKVTAGSREKLVKKLEAGLKETEVDLENQKNSLEKMKEEWKEIESGAFSVHDNYERVKKILEEKQSELEAIQGEYDKMKAKLKEIASFEVDAQCLLEDLQRQGKVLFEKRNQDKLGANSAEEEFIKLIEQLESDGFEEAFIKQCSEPLPEETSRVDCHQKIQFLEEELKEMRPDMEAIKKYRTKLGEYNERFQELEKATSERDSKRAEVDFLRKQRLDEFMAGFSLIAIKLKEMYQMITMGGDAELELVDSLDPFSEGIVFSVRPPKKSWKNITNLSGGEKTLSSLALVFALHHYKPTPLYVMDEIDAALDFKNVSIVANYIKDRTKDAQFIIISLRNNMFELADRLVGIYKTENCTKSVTINPRSFRVASH